MFVEDYDINVGRHMIQKIQDGKDGKSEDVEVVYDGSDSYDEA